MQGLLEKGVAGTIQGIGATLRDRGFVMFLRVFDAILAVLMYGAIMLAALAFVWSFVWFVFGAPWTGLILALLVGLFVCWFVRGLGRDMDRGIEGLIGRLSGESRRDDDRRG